MPRVACPRCGVLHDTMQYIFLFTDVQEIDHDWYQCPTCNGEFHLEEVCYDA